MDRKIVKTVGHEIHGPKSLFCGVVFKAFKISPLFSHKYWKFFENLVFYLSWIIGLDLVFKTFSVNQFQNLVILVRKRFIKEVSYRKHHSSFNFEILYNICLITSIGSGTWTRRLPASMAAAMLKIHFLWDSKSTQRQYGALYNVQCISFFWVLSEPDTSFVPHKICLSCAKSVLPWNFHACLL